MIVKTTLIVTIITKTTTVTCQVTTAKNRDDDSSSHEHGGDAHDERTVARTEKTNIKGDNHAEGYESRNEEHTDNNKTMY